MLWRLKLILRTNYVLFRFDMKKERRLKEKEENKLELEDAILNNEFMKRNAEIEVKNYTDLQPNKYLFKSILDMWLI